MEGPCRHRDHEQQPEQRSRSGALRLSVGLAVGKPSRAVLELDAPVVQGGRTNLGGSPLGESLA